MDILSIPKRLAITFFQCFFIILIQVGIWNPIFPKNLTIIEWGYPYKQYGREVNLP